MISIVIPLYNKAAVICRTMESVKQQIFSDFEILIVNDGSTDDSLSVLMDFLSENEAVFKNSVRLIEQENKGVSAARNQGIKEARGEIIAFLDADDEWLPDYLKTIAFLVEKYPECDIFGTAYSFKMNNMITPASIDYYSFKENEGILRRAAVGMRLIGAENPPISQLPRTCQGCFNRARVVCVIVIDRRAAELSAVLHPPSDALEACNRPRDLRGTPTAQVRRRRRRKRVVHLKFPGL